jgi:hypothetical protein
MKVVPCVISTSVTTARARHNVVGVKHTLTFSEIGEEEHCGSALLARDHDVPSPALGTDHSGTAFCREGSGADCKKSPGRLLSSFS